MVMPDSPFWARALLAADLMQFSAICFTRPAPGKPGAADSCRKMRVRRAPREAPGSIFGLLGCKNSEKRFRVMEVVGL